MKRRWTYSCFSLRLQSAIPVVAKGNWSRVSPCWVKSNISATCPVFCSSAVRKSPRRATSSKVCTIVAKFFLPVLCFFLSNCWKSISNVTDFVFSDLQVRGRPHLLSPMSCHLQALQQGNPLLLTKLHSKVHNAHTIDKYLCTVTCCVCSFNQLQLFSVKVSCFVSTGTVFQSKNSGHVSC